MATWTTLLPLPPDYRVDDMLAFHRRDVQGVAEQVDATSLRKGIVWNGRPALLAVRFVPSQAQVELHVAGRLRRQDDDDLQGLAHRLLGLTQPIEDFEQRYRQHQQLGRLIAARPGLRVAMCATPFEALTWAVTAQQISLGAALSLRRRLIQTAGLRHGSGLLCYPDAAAMAALSPGALHQIGFSQTKARTLIALGEHVALDRLPLDAWSKTLPVDEIRSQLLAVPGIGPWTLSYTLLRGFGYLDGSLHGDVAVRRKLQTLLKAEERLDERYVERWLLAFTPWRALVAAHLWAMPMEDTGVDA